MDVKIEKQNDGTYLAYNNDNDMFVLVGTGETVSEAKMDFFNSIDEIKETFTGNSERVPDYLMGTPVFYFDLASLFEYFNIINVSAFSRYVGINDSLMRQYRKGDTYISEAQLSRIEEGVHKIGAELSSLKLV